MSHGDNEEFVPANYARRVGERLRTVRKQKRLSLQAVESHSAQEFKASVLGAYERGERAISVPRLQRLARFYQVPADQLLPRDSDGVTIDLRDDRDLGEASTQAVDGDERLVIDLAVLDQMEGPERDLLVRFVGSIQVQRQDFNGRVLSIRAEDVKTLGLLLQTTPESLLRRLDESGVRTHPAPC